MTGFAADQITRDYAKRLNGATLPTEAMPVGSRREPDDWSPPAVLRKLQAEARGRGLWSLSLTGERGAGLTNVQYAPLADITGDQLRRA